MIQFNSTSSSSSSSSNYHLFSFLLVLLVLINNSQISANRLHDTSRSDYEYLSPIPSDLSYETIEGNETPFVVYPSSVLIPNEDEIIKPNPWSQLFHRYSERSAYSPVYYSSPVSNMNLRRGEIQYFAYPAQKRAIPIEFQKALFAHGIVGRRR